jgi:hypothetical protein
MTTTAVASERLFNSQVSMPICCLHKVIADRAAIPIVLKVVLAVRFRDIRQYYQQQMLIIIRPMSHLFIDNRTIEALSVRIRRHRHRPSSNRPIDFRHRRHRCRIALKHTIHLPMLLLNHDRFHQCRRVRPSTATLNNRSMASK